jgi:phosphomannomutase
MSLMVSISGIRGVVGSSLTPEVVVRYVAAYAQYCNEGTIAIGYDGRITGKPLAQLVSAILQHAGCDVLDLGICPTPTVALAVERLKTAGGISITASHNPIVWNGLKFFSPTGLFLDTEENEAFWQIANEGNFTYALWDEQGKYSNSTDFLDKHIELILKLPFIDVPKLQQRRFKVAVDAVNAAGSFCVPKLLEKLGCEVIKLNCDGSGIFAHTPEPVPENLTSLCNLVRTSKADIGIAVDPDVDRLVLINEKGEPIGEEYTIATVTKFILSRNKKENPAVVVNLSTTRAIDDIAEEFGAKVIRTPVGEINVAKKMKEVGAIIGGEGSGGVILPDLHYGRDAMVGIALVLQYLLEYGAPLSQLRETLPQYYISKHKIEIGNLHPDTLLKKTINHYKGSGNIIIDDGVKINFEKSWLHLRKSNTEPIIRIIAEAPTLEEVQNLVNECEKFLSGK